MLKTNPPSHKLRRFDEEFAHHHPGLLAGLDEAGRGPWAGPVVAAVVVLPPDFDLPGLNDSKLLSPQKRELLYPLILAQATGFCLALADHTLIDQTNILLATRLAMRRALQGLSFSGGHVLVDGPAIPPRFFDKMSWRQTAVIGGDRQSARIAAASVLAKVTRDRIMQEWDKKYPQYGFAKHKGYGTAEHQDALRRHGPCSIHRKSFAPVREVNAY